MLKRFIKLVNSRKKIFFVFSLVLFTGLLFAQQATNLFISEYVEGSSYHKAIEIFNGTGAAVDLTQYSLKIQRNGNGEFGNELMLQDSLPNNDVFVIVYDHGGDGDLTGYDFVDMATTSQAMSFNGNDAIALCQNGEPLDIVGVVDSSDDWGKNVTLVRNSYVYNPTTTYNPMDWTEYPQDTFDYLGYHDFQGGDTHYLTVLSPNGGEQWEQGSTHNITWTSMNYDGNIKIELLTTNQLREVLVNATENDGEWEWNIPANQPLESDYIIQISSVDSLNLSDTSDDTFSIIEPISYTPYTIHDIQYSTDGPSPHVNELISTEGVVTAIFNSTYFIQDGEGAWNGICVYDTNNQISIGDKISLRALVAEYNDKTELTEVNNVQILGQYPLPEPTLITTAELSSMEDYEGVLVRVHNVTVTDDSLGYGEWEVTDDSGTGCRIDDLGAYSYVPHENDTIYDIEGVVEYSYGNYKLEPRTDNDIDLIGLEVRPATLVFDTYSQATDGLSFTLYNFADTTITINAIQSFGQINDLTWNVDLSSVDLPYSLSPNSNIALNVTIGIPTYRDEYLNGTIPIETSSGNFGVNVFVNSQLVNNAENNVIKPSKMSVNIYPNPLMKQSSKSNLTIKYSIDNSATINLSVFNLKGELIKNILSAYQEKGNHTILWNCLNKNGNQISSGIYFIKISSRNNQVIKKLTIIK